MFNFVMRSKFAARPFLLIFLLIFGFYISITQTKISFAVEDDLSAESVQTELAQAATAQTENLRNFSARNFLENKVLVIGFTGVAWDYLSPEVTPNLLKFAQDNAAGSLVVKTFGATTMPDQGWAALSSGMRMLPGADAKNWSQDISQDIAAIKKANQINSYQPEFGYLGKILSENLFANGKSVKVAGIGPGAALVLTDSNEANTSAFLQDVNQDINSADFAKLPEILTETNLTILDLGSVFNQRKDLTADGEAAGTAFEAAFNPAPAPSAELLSALKVLDSEFGKVIAAVPSNYPMIIASLADSDAQITRLQYLATRGIGDIAGVTTETMDGGNVPAGNFLLGAGSTRQPGIVQITDLLPTIVNAVYGEKTAPTTDKAVGTPIHLLTNSTISGEQVSYTENIAAVQDLNLRAQQVRGGVGYFYLIFGLFGLVAVGYSIFSLLRKKSQAALSRNFLGFTGFIALLPVSSFLINFFPWWRVPAASYLQIGFILLLDFALLFFALRLTSPGIFIASITAGTMIYDVFTESQLHSGSILGYQPQVGARFYGLGNASFVLLAASALFLCAKLLSVLAHRNIRISFRVMAVVAVFAITALVDGSPALGADFGGPPALFLGFATLLMFHLGRRIKVSSLLGLFSFALLAMFGISYVDWLKPASQQSHLGEFFQSVINGDIVAIIFRKLSYIIADIPNFVWIFVLFLALGSGYLVSRNREEITKVLRYGFKIKSGFIWRGEVIAAFVALLVVVLFGFLINDSGLVLPFIGIVYGVPLWINGVSNSLKNQEN
ncbi:MAG: hypothetical protein SPG61_05680 [Arcanobacterium sp.]|nr:hypothetical protein [Arcanobacterium sp.]